MNGRSTRVRGISVYVSADDDPTAPAGAVSVGAWSRDGEFRCFEGTQRETEACGAPVQIAIEGEQYRDGRIDRAIWIDGNICWRFEEGRAFLATMAAAVDELDSLERKWPKGFRRLSSLRHTAS
jgi:hypothetical protein